MEFTGKVIAVIPDKSGTGQNGKPWKTREFVVETVEQYPRRGCFLLRDENIDRFPVEGGMEVKVKFDPNAREWEWRFYNTLTAWGVERK